MEIDEPYITRADEIAAHEAMISRTPMACWKPEVPERGPQGIETVFACLLGLAAIVLLALFAVGAF
jgi:hypothetical protein